MKTQQGAETPTSSSPKRSWLCIAFIGLTVLTVAFWTLFTVQVDQNEKVAEFAFGSPVRNLEEPGLYVVKPWHSFSHLEKRFMLYASDTHQIITSDKKALVTDDFAPWRITNTTLFIQSVGSKAGAKSRLDDSIYSRLNAAFGSHDYTEIVVKDREKIMSTVTDGARTALAPNGIEIAMVQISRVDLPKENKDATYKRMSAERNQTAQTYRSEGNEEALRITSTADRDAKIIVANASRDAEIVKGNADARAAQIYADAYSADPKFYTLMRGLEAAEKAFSADSGSSLRLILKGDEAIFKPLLK